MNEQVIAIYCFLDDFLNKFTNKDETKKTIKDSKILTTAKIHTITAKGFLLSIILFLLSYSMIKTLNICRNLS